MESEVVLWPGVASGTVDVISDVPQGSVRPWANRPTAFIIHNDLPKSLPSKVRLFADNAIV